MIIAVVTDRVINHRRRQFPGTVHANRRIPDDTLSMPATGLSSRCGLTWEWEGVERSGDVGWGRDVLYMTVPFGVCNKSANLGRFIDNISLLDSVSTAEQSFVATVVVLSPAYSSRRTD